MAKIFIKNLNFFIFVLVIMLSSQFVVAGDQYPVLCIVDGDTIVIDYHGTKEKVRLLCVNTPESVHPDRKQNIPLGKVTDSGIQPITVSRIVQKRSKMAGFDPILFGGHSLRSGFVTEAGMKGKPMGDIMALSGHRTVSIVSWYYQAGNELNNSAAKLAG